MAKQKYGEPTKMLAVRVPVSLLRKLDGKAKRAKTGRAEAVVRTLERGLARQEKTGTAGVFE